MRLTLWITLAVSIAALGAPRAHAEPDSVNEIAERLFNEGRALSAANRWAEACIKFEASLRADPAIGTRLNLALCYVHIGKLGGAWRLYRESMKLAEQRGDATRRDYAQSYAAALEPRLAKLVISARAAPPAGFAMTWTDMRVDADALNIAVYVDPGTYQITSSAPGFEPLVQTVVLVEGEHTTLAAPALKAVQAPPPSAVARLAVTAPTTIMEHAQPPASGRRYLALGTGAAGAAALGVAVFFGVKAHTSYGDAKALCGAKLVCGASDYDHGQQLIRDTRSSTATATVLAVIGGAAIATSVILFATAPRHRATISARIAPLAHDRGVGLAILGGF